MKYGDYLKTANPFLSKCEPAEKCFVCSTSDKPTDCKVTNIGYSLRCRLCWERNKHVSYEGESNRNGYLRGGEHLRDFRSRSKRSVLFRHVMAEHKTEEEQVKFEMKIVGKFKDCTNRQVEESLRIRHKKPELLLNSKSEFYGPVIKRKIYES